MSKNSCFLSIVAILFFAPAAQAQKKASSATSAAAEKQKQDPLYGHYKKVYDEAVKYNDLAVARTALYSMLALDPSRTGLKDTLTYLYFSSNNHLQVILLGKEILEANPGKAEILELVAVSQQNLGREKDALESFEKLYSITKDPYHQYSIASLQYMLKRFGECSESLNSIIASTDSLGVITISDNQGESQQVPIKAAAFNMRGVVALEINQPEVARQNFQKALELFPGFLLAKANLEKVNSQLATSSPEKKK